MTSLSPTSHTRRASEDTPLITTSVVKDSTAVAEPTNESSQNRLPKEETSFIPKTKGATTRPTLISSNPSPDPSKNEDAFRTISDQLSLERGDKRKREITHFQGIPISFIMAPSSASLPIYERKTISPRRVSRFQKAFTKLSLSSQVKRSVYQR